MSEHNYGIKIMTNVSCPAGSILADSASPKKNTEVQMCLHAWFTCIEAALLCILMPGINTITRQTYSQIRVRNLDGEAQKPQSV